METIIDHLTRFKIEDLMEELTINGVLNSRVPEILKIFKNSLGEGPYYCICYRNPTFKELENREKGSHQAPENLKAVYENRLKRCYKIGKTSYSLRTVLIEFSGNYFSVIKQTIEPKTAKDFAYMEEYQNYYISKEVVNIFSNKVNIGE